MTNIRKNIIEFLSKNNPGGHDQRTHGRRNGVMSNSDGIASSRATGAGKKSSFKMGIKEARQALDDLGLKTLLVNNSKRSEIEESLGELVLHTSIFAETFGVNFDKLSIRLESAYDNANAEYNPTFNQITIYSKGGESMGHELAHWFDKRAGNESGIKQLRSYISESGKRSPINDIVDSMKSSSEFKRWEADDKIRSDPYLSTPVEMFARAMDQYLYSKNPKYKKSVDQSFPWKKPLFIKSQGWIPQKEFDEKIAPLVESLIAAKLVKSMQNTLRSQVHQLANIPALSSLPPIAIALVAKELIPNDKSQEISETLVALQKHLDAHEQDWQKVMTIVKHLPGQHEQPLHNPNRRASDSSSGQVGLGDLGVAQRDQPKPESPIKNGGGKVIPPKETPPLDYTPRPSIVPKSLVNKETAMKELLALPIPDRIKAFGSKSQEEKDNIADATRAIQSDITKRLAYAGQRPTEGTAKDAIAIRSKQLEANISSQSMTLINKHANDLADLFETMKVDPKVARELTLDMMDAVAAQDDEARGRALGDHGARHILGDTEMANAILEKVPGFDSPASKAMMILAGAFHDTGYLAEPSKFFMDADHPRWSVQHYEANLKEKVTQAFGKEEADFLQNIIATHADSGIDWEADPVTSAFRVADNIALFQKEKLPALISEVPLNKKVLVDLSKGLSKATSDAEKKSLVTTARKQAQVNIQKSSLKPHIKEQLVKASEEISPLLVKFTTGMLGGDIDGFEFQDNSLTVNVKKNGTATYLNDILDLGQRQFKKFAESYSVNPETFLKTGEMEFSQGSGVVLRARIKAGKDLFFDFMESLDTLQKSFFGHKGGAGSVGGSVPRDGASPIETRQLTYEEQVRQADAALGQQNEEWRRAKEAEKARAMASSAKYKPDSALTLQNCKRYQEQADLFSAEVSINQNSQEVQSRLKSPPSPEAIATAELLESEFSEEDKEYATTIDENGEFIVPRLGKFGGGRSGAKNRVRYKGDELQELQDLRRSRPYSLIYTHNHPGGDSFSLSDFQFASQMKLREVRAIGVMPKGHGEIKYLYRLEFKSAESGDLHASQSIQSRFKRMLRERNKSYKKEYQDNHSEITKIAQRDGVDSSRIKLPTPKSDELVHNFWTQLAKEYPDHISYSREIISRSVQANR